MAKAIATVGGIALAPGVSKNRRLYTAETIAKAVKRAQDRIAAGDAMPISTLTHHGAEGDPTRIVGGLKSLTLDEQGRARFVADLAGTSHGQTIASLADTTDGQPAFLKGVSIRGRWLGKVKRIPGPDGAPVETADDLEIDGLDYTPNPGVGAAGIDSFAWAGDGKRASETTELVLISESVEEALVTISEDTEPAADTSPANEASDPPGDVLELAAHVLEDGECVTCAREAARPMGKRTSGTSGPGGPYADPGYQDDKKQRYQLDTKAHAKAAWSFINKASNAKLYSAAQLKRIKGRIMKALRKFGVKTTAEGWVIDTPVLITEAIAEHYGDPTLCGSWSINATNGPVSINLSSYSMDPADLDVILRAAADAACLALSRLDPDMDGDIDVPGAPASDTDDDMASASAVPPLTLSGESAESTDPADSAESQEEAPAPEPAAGDTTEGDPEMSESNTAAETAPAAATFTQADLDAAAERAARVALDADREARRARKAARRAQPAESAPPVQPAQPAEAAPAAPAAVQESEDERINRIVAAKLAEDRGQAAPPVQESDEDRINRIVEERLTEARQNLVATGRVAVQRAGLVKPVSEAAAALSGSEELNEYGVPASWPNKPLHEYTPDERDTYMGPALVGHVLGARASMLG